MAPNHASLGLVAMAFLSGSMAMLFFVILSGVTRTPPLNNTFFLEAETFGIEGARPVTQWTYFYVCGAFNLNCSPAEPAMALGSAWAPPGRGAPRELVGEFGGGTTSHFYWYMWRFGWVFFLLTLIFEVMAFFAGFAACFGRLGSAMAGLVSILAFFFYTIAVSLMTATFVKARNAFLSEGRPARLGDYAFGFSWGGWAALFLAVALFCAGTRGGGKKKSANVAPGGIFGRRRRRPSVRSTRSVGSRRVKEEYV